MIGDLEWQYYLKILEKQNQKNPLLMWNDLQWIAYQRILLVAFANLLAGPEKTVDPEFGLFQ